jgi:hypothetical protein
MPSASSSKTGKLSPTARSRPRARSGGVNLDPHIHDIDAALWWWDRPGRAISQTVGAADGVHSVLCQWEYRGGKLEQFTQAGREEVDLSGPGGHAAEVPYFVDCLHSSTPVTRCLPTDRSLSVAYALGQI